MDYGSSKWKKKRAHILRLDKYKDRIAQRYGKTIEATTVHHIYPVDDYPEYAWDDWNLISISTATHNKLHERETKRLTAEGIALMNRTTPGRDWRKK